MFFVFLGLFDEIESSKEQHFTVHCLNVILPPPHKKQTKQNKTFEQ